MAQDYQVIVVGAGLSGLSAAKWLKDSGLTVLTLEARNRVGGRTYTIKDPRIDYVDLGGAYVGPTQDRLLRIAKEMGVQNYKVNEVEDLLHYKNGRRKRFGPNEMPSRRNPLANMDINYVFWLMDEMGKEIPADAPWDAPHADEWDTMTFKEFLKDVCWTNAAYEFFSAFISINITTEAYEASLLSFLWYVKQCGGTKRIFSTTNGGQERKFYGGSQQISEKLAKTLGDDILLNKPVVGITQEAQSVVVKTLDGSEYTAKYIILATPPAVQMKIHYEPPLPPLRNQLIQRMPMGTVMKCIIYYRTTFWRQKGREDGKHLQGVGLLQGRRTSDALLGICGSLLIEGDDSHPMFLTLDDTKPDGSHPAIIGFILADKCRRLVNVTKEERKRRICKSLAVAMDCKEALEPIHYEEKNWMEEQYSGGCYTAMYPPGLFTRYGRVLRKPVGRMYFAGTETATEWSGYMEGAIQAGERAAREILNAMGKIPSSQIWQKEPPSEDVKSLPFQATLSERFLPSVSGFLKLVGFSTILATASAGAFYYQKYFKK